MPQTKLKCLPYSIILIYLQKAWKRGLYAMALNSLRLQTTNITILTFKRQMFYRKRLRSNQWVSACSLIVLCLFTWIQVNNKESLMNCFLYIGRQFNYWMQLPIHGPHQRHHGRTILLSFFFKRFVVRMNRDFFQIVREIYIICVQLSVRRVDLV